MKLPGQREPGGRLLDNLLHFARTLRAAGMRVGPGDVLEAVRAVEAVGIGRRDDFQAVLSAVLVKRPQDRQLFDEAFHIFWKDPDLLRRMMSLLLPRLALPGEEERKGSQRLMDALSPGTPAPDMDRQPVEFDAALDWSDREHLGAKDFDKMTAAEFADARQLIRLLRLPLAEVRTRRLKPAGRGHAVHMRSTFRASLRTAGDAILLRYAAPVTKPPPVVALCDISGSMERYARVFLHFMHAMASTRRRFHAFVFGTRLTNVTRALTNRDPDEAVAAASALVTDWSGGTRIGESLHDFNRHWSRRVLGQGAVVLLMTDGLDRASDAVLAPEIERLHKSCRRLIWLNPLLRWDGFEPRAAGIRAMLPHVDEFRPVHNLNCLEALVAALSVETEMKHALRPH